ncbi:MAG: thermosome subunit alpha [Halobacteriota archaeon]|nr:thermosome subunit alpha [Halobacteriota archaeon]
MKRVSSEKDAHTRVTRSNIIVAMSFVSMIKSSLGPLGSHKIIIDRDNFIIVTRDGRTIFENIEVVHPIEKLLVTLSKTIDEEVGDGTTSVVILTGELLSNALKLIDAGLHPSTIVRGYQAAGEKSMELIDDLALPVEDTMLKQIAITALNSKTLDQYKDVFADMIIEALMTTSKKEEDEVIVDHDSVYFERVQGKSTLETELIKGIIVESQVMPPGMPTKIEDAKVLLLDTDITFDDVKKDRYIELNVDDPSQIEDMHLSTFDFFEEIAEKIVASGANAVFNMKSMDSIGMTYLGKKGVLATTNVRGTDLKRISKVTGAKVINDINSLSDRDLGHAERVYQKKLGDFKFIFMDVEDTATILIRGGSKQVIDETYRTLNDALHTTANAIKHKAILPGGGATETYLSQAIKKHALSIKTKKQLAITAFADALETIPMTLAHNSGEDPVSAIIELRRRHETDGRYHGLDVTKREIVDMVREGVLEPLIMKKSVIRSASETAQVILRADDYIPKKLTD